MYEYEYDDSLTPEENEEARIEHEEFLRTGVSRIKMNIQIKITEEDMLRDLVYKTEGKNIEIDKDINLN